jgi:hypothetical protein
VSKPPSRCLNSLRSEQVGKPDHQGFETPIKQLDITKHCESLLQIGIGMRRESASIVPCRSIILASASCGMPDCLFVEFQCALNFPYKGLL